jgi:hypothetical protein
LTVSRAVITERCRCAVIPDSVLTVSAIADTAIADTVALALTASATVLSMMAGFGDYFSANR